MKITAEFDVTEAEHEVTVQGIIDLGGEITNEED